MLGLGFNPQGQVPPQVSRAVTSIPDSVSGQLLQPTDSSNYFQVEFTTPAVANAPITAQCVIQPVSALPTIALWVGIGLSGAGRTRATLNMATGEFTGFNNLENVANYSYGMLSLSQGTFFVWFTSAMLSAVSETEFVRLAGITEDIRAGAFMVSQSHGPQVFEATTGTPGTQNLVANSDGSGGLPNNITASAATITVR